MKRVSSMLFIYLPAMGQSTKLSEKVLPLEMEEGIAVAVDALLPLRAMEYRWSRMSNY